MNITLEKFDRKVTGQSGCELKIAKTRFGHKTIRPPVFFLFFSKLVEGIYIIYIMKII